MHSYGCRHAKLIALLTGVYIAISVCLPGIDAWSNGGYSADPDNPDYGTHDWIAEMALDLQTLDVTFLEVTYHSEFLLGTEWPDNPDYIGDSVNHHVYYYSDGSLQDDVGADRAEVMYDAALGYLLTDDYENAAFYIGAMTHYVSDVGVFGHTMGAYTDWGSEVHHSDYESEFESMLESLDPPSGILLGNLDAYTATLELAEDITFGSELIMANTWMDDNYDWGEPTFVASAMASLYGSVEAVAAAINHLIAEAEDEEPPTPSPPTPTIDVPQPPRELTCSMLDSSVMLTWSPPSSDGGAALTGYRVYRGLAVDSPSQVDTVSAEVHAWLDETVDSGKTYYYWVAAVNTVGFSEMSEAVSIVIPEDTGTETNDSDSSTLTVIVLGIVTALASGGAVYWRRKAGS